MAMASSKLKKLSMPASASESLDAEEGMDLGMAEEESAEDMPEMPAPSDLEAVSDEDLIAEIRARGLESKLAASEEMPEEEMPGEEMGDEESEEYA